jgi:putative inorganic carbon (HCO3(-)) transporter
MKVDHSYQQVESHAGSAALGRLRRAAAFLAELEIWLVGGTIAASVAVARLLPIAAGIAAAYWLIRWVGTGRLSRRTPADWAVGLLALMIPVTLWATALPEDAVPQVLRLLTGIGLFYAIVNWSSSAMRLRLLVTGMILTGAVLALIAPFSVDWFTSGKLAFIPSSIYERFTLLFADTVHPNVMGGYLAMLVPISLTAIVFNWNQLSWFKRASIAFVVVIMVGFLVLTKSRGAWMAFGAVLILLTLLRWRRGWLALPAFGIAGIAVLYSLGITRVLEILSYSNAFNGIDGRLEIWSRAIYMIQDFPFTGIGMGSFMRVADTLYPFFLVGSGKVVHAHSLFLQIAVDLGLPGFIAWLAIFVLVIVAAWQVYKLGKVEHNGLIAGLGAGLLGSQLALTIHGITDAVTWGLVRPAPLIWAVWGLAFASWYVYVFPENKPPDTRPVSQP